MDIIDKKLLFVDSLIAKREFLEAVKLCTEIVEKYPEEAIGYRKRSRIYSMMGEHKRAIEDRSHAIKINADNPSDYFFRGEWHLEIGSYKDSISDFSSVIKIEKIINKEWYTETAYFCRAHAYLYCHEYDKAFKDSIKVKNGFRYFFRGRLRTKNDLEHAVRQGGLGASWGPGSNLDY